MNSDEIKETLRRIPVTTIKPEDYLHSGSTLLNLACSGTPYGAFCKGKYFWVVGDSSSGKTFLTLTSFAEAAINPSFDGYDLVYDNAENGALMDLEHFYGPKMADRLEPPRLVDGEAVYSKNIEDFYFNVADRIKAARGPKGRPFIYLLDSMDSLSSKYDKEKFEEKLKEARGGKKAKGDYGDGKAKVNSRWIRQVTADLEESNSILIVLSQTRDNIDGGMFDPDSVASGGRALKFYACFQLWSSVGKALTREINGTERQIGIISCVRTVKNRLTGKSWRVEFPIYWSTGIDDIGGMIDFLIKEKHWVDNKAPEFEFSGTKAKLIRKIEQEGLRDRLVEIVVKVWKDIEAQCVVERVNKYR
jgi:RecA/RadA recombinase